MLVFSWRTGENHEKSLADFLGKNQTTDILNMNRNFNHTTEAVKLKLLIRVILFRQCLTQQEARE
jgi:hypothetical protein